MGRGARKTRGEEKATIGWCWGPPPLTRVNQKGGKGERGGAHQYPENEKCLGVRLLWTKHVIDREIARGSGPDPREKKGGKGRVRPLPANLVGKGRPYSRWLPPREGRPKVSQEGMDESREGAAATLA